MTKLQSHMTKSNGNRWPSWILPLWRPSERRLWRPQKMNLVSSGLHKSVPIFMLVLVVDKSAQYHPNCSLSFYTIKPDGIFCLLIPLVVSVITVECCHTYSPVTSVKLSVILPCLGVVSYFSSHKKRTVNI